MTFYVTLAVRSQTDNDQPRRLAMSGEWADRSTAERKYRAWIGEYGGTGGVASLVEEAADGTRRVLDTWTG
ncbi:hypothetical protein [Streptomyces sp. NPDC012508]|uniref:hypothetical protein n=1 Tax=Streptomyces sp. NPDC012508 TaxID=3364837 RepID=UPI0036CB6E5A